MANFMSRVRTTWTAGTTGLGLSTFYFAHTTLPDATAAQAVVDRVRDFWAAWRLVVYGGYSWTTQGTVDVLDYVSGALQASNAVTARSASGFASGGGDPLPNVLQCLLRMETGTLISGRRFRGRLFMPGLTEVDSGTNSQPSAAAITAGANAATALLGSSTVPWVVWHRPANPGVGGSGGDIRAVTAATLQPKFAVLRSRRD